jgi:hypothetical protein
MGFQFIKINNAIARNKEVSEGAKLMFALFSANKKNGEYNIFCTNISSIIHMLNGKYNTTTIKSYKKDLKEIIDIGAVTLFSDMSYKYEISTSNLKAGDYFYIRINDGFIESKDFINQFNFNENDTTEFNILQYKGFSSMYIDDFVRFLEYEFPNNIKKAKLFSVYLVILSRANIDFKNVSSLSNINYESLDTMCLYANAELKSIVEYTKILCDSQFIFKVTLHEYKSKSINSRNIYARYRDRSRIFRALDTDLSGLPFTNFAIRRINNIEITNEQSDKIMKTIKELNGTINNDIVDKYILQKLLINC